MTLIRMLAFRPATVGGSAMPPVPSSAGKSPSAKLVTTRSPSAKLAAPSSSTAGVRPTLQAAGPAEAPQWSEILAHLDLSGAARQLAANCALLSREGDVVALSIDPRHATMATPAQRDRLTRALSEYFGSTIRIEWHDDATGAAAVETPAQARERGEAERLAQARRSLEDDPTVKALQERFGATLHAETVRPAKR